LTVALLSVIAGMTLAMGVYLLATSRRMRVSLYRRLNSNQVRHVADEAEEWLRGQ